MLNGCNGCFLVELEIQQNSNRRDLSCFVTRQRDAGLCFPAALRLRSP